MPLGQKVKGFFLPPAPRSGYQSNEAEMKWRRQQLEAEKVRINAEVRKREERGRGNRQHTEEDELWRTEDDERWKKQDEEGARGLLATEESDKQRAVQRKELASPQRLDNDSSHRRSQQTSPTRALTSDLQNYKNELSGHPTARRTSNYNLEHRGTNRSMDLSISYASGAGTPSNQLSPQFHAPAKHQIERSGKPGNLTRSNEPNRNKHHKVRKWKNVKEAPNSSVIVDEPRHFGNQALSQAEDEEDGDTEGRNTLSSSVQGVIDGDAPGTVEESNFAPPDGLEYILTALEVPPPPPLQVHPRKSESPATTAYLEHPLLSRQPFELDSAYEKGSPIVNGPRSAPTDRNLDVASHSSEAEKTNESLRVAQSRLYLMLEKIKAADRQDNQLALSINAEEAATHLVEKYRHVIHSWTAAQGRCESLETSLRHFNELKQQVAVLEHKNTQLSKDAELSHERGKVIKLTEDKLARAEASLHQVQVDHAGLTIKVQTECDQKIAREKGVLKDQLETVTREKKSLEQQYENLRRTEVNNNEAVNRLNQEVASLKKTVDRLEADKRGFAKDKHDLIKRHGIKLREEEIRLEREHQTTIIHLREKISRLEAEKAGLQEHWIGEMNAAHQDHIDNIAAKDYEQGKTLREVTDKHRQEKSKLDSSWRDQVAQWEKSHAELQNDISRQKEELATLHDAEKDKLRAEIARLRAEADKVESRVRGEEREKQERFTQRAQRELNDVKNDNEALKGALTRREMFKGIPDPIIESRFKRLANMVDQFSRVRWDKSRERTWPFQENVLRQHENPRQLSQFVIQDNVWTILYDHIFDQPFEMFGKESISLYSEWTSSHGRDPESTSAPHWPVPTTASEKFRYDAVKECLDAVDKRSGGQSEDKERRKAAYMQSTAEIGDEIVRSLSSVTPTNNGHSSTARDIVIQAAKLWFDIGVQHCRILIVIPAGSRGSSKARSTKDSGELIVQPAVERVGNSQGEDLHKAAVIICKMETYKTRSR